MQDAIAHESCKGPGRHYNFIYDWKVRRQTLKDKASRAMIMMNSRANDLQTVLPALRHNTGTPCVFVMPLAGYWAVLPSI